MVDKHNLKELTPVKVGGICGLIIDVENGNDLGRKIYTIFYCNKGKWIKYRIRSEDVAYSPDFIYMYCKAKVLDYKTSGSEFGFPTLKAALVGQIFPINEMGFGKETKKGKIIDFISINTGERNLKFCSNDIKIIYPNYKGFHTKKDKTPKPGITLIAKVSVKSPLVGNKDYILSNIIRKDFNNKVRDILVTELESGMTLRSKFKNFKVK